MLPLLCIAGAGASRGLSHTSGTLLKVMLPPLLTDRCVEPLAVLVRNASDGIPLIVIDTGSE